MSQVATADLGGSKLSLALVTSGLVVPLHRSRSPQSVEQLVCELQKALRFADCDGVALAVAGITRNGREVIESPNLSQFNGVPLASLVEQSLGTPCVVVNDMVAAALAEGEYGELTSVKAGLVFTNSTGIGGSIFMRTRCERRTLACEPGHMVLWPGGPVCSCGRRGCVEAVCSGGAVRRELEAQFGGRIPAGMDPSQFLDEAAVRGEPWAIQKYSEIGWAMGLALANCLNLHSEIERIVLTGTFAMRGDSFLRTSTQRAIREHAMFVNHRSIAIEPSKLWPNGAHLGAAIAFYEGNKGSEGSHIPAIGSIETDYLCASSPP